MKKDTEIAAAIGAERGISQRDNTLWNRNVVEINAGPERIRSDVGNIVTNDDVGHAFITAGVGGNTRHGPAVGRVRDNEISFGPSIAGDGDGAIIGGEHELRFRHS